MCAPGVRDQPATDPMCLQTDPLARTSSLPPTGGRGWASPLPSREEVGDGWGIHAAEAMSQLPGPPHRRSPPSPPRRRRGRSGGIAVGQLAMKAAKKKTGPAATANDVTGPLAERAREELDTPSRAGVAAADVTPSVSDWRGGRAGSSTSVHGDGRPTALHPGAHRQLVDAGHLAVSPALALRQGWPPEGARRWGIGGGSTRSATARPRSIGRRPHIRSRATPCRARRTRTNYRCGNRRSGAVHHAMRASSATWIGRRSHSAQTGIGSSSGRCSM